MKKQSYPFLGILGKMYPTFGTQNDEKKAAPNDAALASWQEQLVDTDLACRFLPGFFTFWDDDIKNAIPVGSCDLFSIS